MKTYGCEWIPAGPHTHNQSVSSHRLHYQPATHASMPIALHFGNQNPGARWTKQCGNKQKHGVSKTRPPPQFHAPLFLPYDVKIPFHELLACQGVRKYGLDSVANSSNRFDHFEWRYVPIAGEAEGNVLIDEEPAENDPPSSVSPTLTTSTKEPETPEKDEKDEVELLNKALFPFGRPFRETQLPAQASLLQSLRDHELIHALIGRDHDEQHPATAELRVRGWHYNRLLRCWYRPSSKEPKNRYPKFDVMDVFYFEVNHRRQLTGLKLVVNFRWVHAEFL